MAAKEHCSIREIYAITYDAARTARFMTRTRLGRDRPGSTLRHEVATTLGTVAVLPLASVPALISMLCSGAFPRGIR